MQWNQLSKILVFVIFGIHDSCVYRYKRQGVHEDRGDYEDHSEEVEAVEAMGKVSAMGEMQTTRFLLGMGALEAMEAMGTPPRLWREIPIDRT